MRPAMHRSIMIGAQPRKTKSSPRSGLPGGDPPRSAHSTTRPNADIGPLSSDSTSDPEEIIDTADSKVDSANQDPATFANAVETKEACGSSPQNSSAVPTTAPVSHTVAQLPLFRKERRPLLPRTKRGPRRRFDPVNDLSPSLSGLAEAGDMAKALQAGYKRAMEEYSSLDQANKEFEWAKSDLLQQKFKVPYEFAKAGSRETVKRGEDAGGGGGGSRG